jgi:magnesium-protoporphyrin O-methyltransferase
MNASSYAQRKHTVETYFDRTALEAWRQLTSDTPVSRIRATVRQGRDRMRNQLLAWLPENMTGLRLLDAGCGTGAFAYEAARRGAEVIGVDVSASLLEIASQRLPSDIPDGMIDFRSGDMLDPEFGDVDVTVAMDSLIHYDTKDIVAALGELARRTSMKIVFTVAPRTPMLTVMHMVGRAFPRGDRAPSIVPVADRDLRRRIADEPLLTEWTLRRSALVNSGFYLSHALELVRR